MAAIQNVEVNPLSPERFDEVLDDAGRKALDDLIGQAREAFAGRTIWSINSTAAGGGVAEMLASLLAYTSGAGVDSRWIVINGNEPFFRLTKRIHNRLHGYAGDGGPLGDAEREIYDSTLADKVDPVKQVVRPGDIVLVHDPQPAGLIEPLREHGAKIVWRLHVGADTVNERV